MDLFIEFLLKNFFLLCLTLAVIFMVIRSYHTKKTVVFFPIIIVSLSLFLSLIYFLEKLTTPYQDLVFLTTLCCALGFIIRPLVLYFFIRMTIGDKKILVIAWVLMGINALVYLLSLFIFARDLTSIVIYFDHGEAFRGPLFFTCHVIIGIMMIYFVSYSIYSLKGRHRYDAIACLICGVFVLVSVILETLSLAEYLLNTTIAISVLFYVVHLYQQASVRDALTGLYDRHAYYFDVSQIESKVNGLIVIDMNYLKWINDNKGHLEGDHAITTIAKIIHDSLDSKHMDAYRVGGDEFVILCTSSRFAAIDNTINNINEKMGHTEYTVAIGYAKRENENQTVSEMTKIAEKMMYENKANFYKSSGIERRKH